MARRCGIARGVRAVRDARRARAVLVSASCVLVPPVPLHKKGAGGMPRAQLARLDRQFLALTQFVAHTGTQQTALRPANCWRSASVTKAGPTSRPTFEDAKRVIFLADGEHLTSP